MNLLTLEQMFRIRDNIIARTQNTNFHSAMCSLIYERYPHIWKYAETVAKTQVELKFDRECRQWKIYHKQGLFTPTSFDKKPCKTLLTLKVLWQIAKEVSRGNQHFLTVH